MPVNKRMKLWCKDDMVRAIVMVRDQPGDGVHPRRGGNL